MLPFGMEFTLVVAFFAKVPIQIALLVLQLMVGLVQTRSIALQRVLVTLQFAQIGLELGLVFRGQVVVDSLPIALYAFLGSRDRLAVAVYGLLRLVHRCQVVADVLLLVLNALFQAS